MKYLILIDQKNLSELDKELIEYLETKDKNNKIYLKPFLDSVDENQIKDKLDKLEIKDKESILEQIFEDKNLIYLLDSEECIYNMAEVLIELTENHPAMKSYLIDKKGYK